METVGKGNTMENSLFSDEILSVLTDQVQWKLVGTRFPTQVEAVNNPSHLKWMKSNTHEHNHREILFVLNGEGFCGLEGKVYPCEAGTVFFFEPFEKHDLGYENKSSNALHFWMFFFHDQITLKLLKINKDSSSGTAIWNILIPAMEFEPLIEKIAAGSKEPPELLRMRYLALAVSIVTETIHTGYSNLEVKADDLQAIVVDTVRKHIRETAGRGIDLDTLALISGYSKFHLLRVFKERTGHTIHEYIDRSRTERVKELEGKNISKSRIAEELGFSSLSAFSRWYKNRSSQHAERPEETGDQHRSPALVVGEFD